jgi:hypothetical protein
MNIPEPMIPPMTIIVASNRPSRAASPEGPVCIDATLFFFEGFIDFRGRFHIFIRLP